MTLNKHISTGIHLGENSLYTRTHTHTHTHTDR